MLKKFALSAVTAAVIVASQFPSTAHATPATDVGTKIAEKVATLVLGEVFSSIFGGADPAATPQEVQNIVNEGFNKAAMNEIDTQLGAVMSSIVNYNWQLDYATTNSQAIHDLYTEASCIQSNLKTHMSHNNFVPLIKTYVTASTVRIAFLSERRRNVKILAEAEVEAGTKTAEELASMIAGENTVIANAAFDSLSDLANFFYEDFYETAPGQQGCIYKYPETPWITSDGRLGANRDATKQDRSTVSCRNYANILPQEVTSVGDAIAGVDVYHSTPWKSTDIQQAKKNDLWAFSVRKWDSNPGPFNNDYHMLMVKGEDLARYVRNLNSISKYPDLLGDIEGQVLSWVDIIAANGDQELLTHALKKATELGVEQSTLANRYVGKHPDAIIALKTWFADKLRGWGLNNKMAPTRIAFPKDNPYPTEAPQWLGAAMN